MSLKIYLKPHAVDFLDLSATFDKTDNNILLQRLEHDSGITRMTLKWFIYDGFNTN